MLHLFYTDAVTLHEYFLVFPDGDIQEISRPISVSSFVDMNGYPVQLPLTTNRMIVYQVARMQTRETEPGIICTYYLLGQLNAMELSDYVQ